MQSLENLEIFKMAYQQALDCRKLSLNLDYPDKSEVGSQLRRSSQSVKDNIVEGYGRRRYKREYIKFLTYSYASNLEAKYQLKFIKDINPQLIPESIYDRTDKLGIMIFRFIKYLDNN